MLAAIKAGLELSHPGTPAGEIDLVEKDLPRPAGRSQAALEVFLKGLDPQVVPVGVADEGGVLVGHGRSQIL